MRPVLFELFGVELPSFAVFMVLGFCTALYVVFRQVPRTPIPAAQGGSVRHQQLLSVGRLVVHRDTHIIKSTDNGFNRFGVDHIVG